MDISLFNDIFSFNDDDQLPIKTSLMNIDCILNEFSEEKETLAYIKITILTIKPWIFMSSVFIIIAILVFFKKMRKFNALS